MLKKRQTAVVFLLFIFLLTSCRSRDEKQNEVNIEKTIEIGEEHPTKALLILHFIKVSEELDKKNFMLYQIANVRAKRNANIEITAEETALVNKASEYFEKEKDSKNAGLANYYSARACKAQNNTTEELDHYLRAYSYMKGKNDSLLMGKTLYNVASLYYDLEIYDSTFIYLQKAIPLFINYPEKQIQAYQLFASCYYLNNDYSNALQSLDRGRRLLHIEKDKEDTYLYNKTYGAIYKRLQKYDKAANYLRKNLEKENTPTEQLRAMLNLTDIYTLTQSKDSAYRYVKMSEPLLSHLEVKNIDNDHLLLLAYRIFHDYYIEQEDKMNIKKYFDLFSKKQSEIDKTNIVQTLLNTNEQTKEDASIDLYKFRNPFTTFVYYFKTTYIL